MIMTSWLRGYRQKRFHAFRGDFFDGMRSLCGMVEAPIDKTELNPVSSHCRICERRLLGKRP